jgi:hypothetical protein
MAHRVKRILSESWVELKNNFPVISFLTLILGIITRFFPKLTLLSNIIIVIAIVMLFIWVITVALRKKHIEIPIMFEENPHVDDNLFTRFMESSGVTFDNRLVNNDIKCLSIRLIKNKNPRTSKEPDDWKKAWNEIVKKWEELEKQVRSKIDKGIGYIVFPHVPIALAFALGASVNLRRPIKLSHFQEDSFYPVLRIQSRTYLFPEKISDKYRPPEIHNNFDKNLSTNDKKLDVYISIGRHEINPQVHSRDCYYIILKYDNLNPEIDWLPYVQHIVKIVNRLINNYKEVNIRLITPSVIAFALGMAFSRSQNITVSAYLDNNYFQVFSLKTIENEYPLDSVKKRLPFS